MEVPRLRVELELQPLAYAAALKHRILNTLSKARDQTCILMDTSQVHNSLSHNGNSERPLLTSLHLKIKVEVIFCVVLTINVVQ